MIFKILCIIIASIAGAAYKLNPRAFLGKAIGNAPSFIESAQQFIVKPLQSTVVKPGIDRPSYMSKDFEKSLKLGVLFLNLGGPENIEDVEGFLFNLFADPDIIRLPPLLSVLQKPLAYFISKQRAPKSASAYESIGGGSPIVKYTREQSQLIEESLRQRGFEQTKCYFAMRYWHPFTEEALQQIQDDAINTLVVVPLYPQFSISTSGSSLRLLQETFSKDKHIWGPDKVAHTVIPSWYHRPGYIRVMASLIIDQLKAYNQAEMVEGLHVLFTAHGVPTSYINAGDPYQRQIQECTRLIAEEVSRLLASDSLRPAGIDKSTGMSLAGGGGGAAGDSADSKFLSMAKEMFDSSYSSSSSSSAGFDPTAPFDQPAVTDTVTADDTDTDTGASASSSTDASTAIKPVKFHLSYQSRVGPVKWLEPYTEDKLIELGEKKAVRNLVVVPISFVSEHIETLEEIDIEYKELAEEAGISNWRRVPALNTDPRFIEDMADLVVEALEAPTLTVAEAASTVYSDVLDSSASNQLSNNIKSNNNNNNKIAGNESLLTKGVAMLSLVSTSAIEVFNHHPVLQMLGFK